MRFLFSRKTATYWFIGALIAGSVLRLLWLADMEWKADEKLMFGMAERVVTGDKLPALGMKSGVGLPNAGFSVWPFVLFRMIYDSPVGMAVCVAVCNILALVLMWVCAGKSGDRSDLFRAGVAVASVNVLAVVFSRKIWAQDLMPLFVACLWYLILLPQGKVKWILIGLLSMLAGQLHISGFYLAAGLLLALIWRGDCRLKQSIWLLLGMFIGMIPAVPWISEIYHQHATHDTHWNYIFRFEFFIRFITDPTGLNVHYSLGNDVWNFIRYSGNFILIPAISIVAISLYAVFMLIKNRCPIQWRISVKDPMVFLLMAFVVIPGTLLTLSGTPIRSHYLIACVPFMHVAWVWLWQKAGLKYVILIVLMQFAVTLAFLHYIHVNGAANGDYGIPYSKQLLMNEHR